MLIKLVQVFSNIKLEIMRTILKIFTVCSLGITMASINSCSKGDSYGSAGGVEATSVNLVTIQAGQFQPSAITIIEGSTVTWRNSDNDRHTVTSDDGISFSSGNISSQGYYTINAPAAGAYPYHCSIHPSEKGTLYVAVKSH